MPENTDGLRDLLIRIVKSRGKMDFSRDIENQQLLIEAVHEYNQLISGIDKDKLIRSEDLEETEWLKKHAQNAGKKSPIL